MIQLEGISKRFGAIEAIRHLDLEIRPDEWLGLFGHNGSGKTTLLRVLVGLSKPSGGKILFDGKPPDPEGWRSFRRKLGFMPERIVFWEHLTGEETLAYFARLRGVRPHEVGPILEQVGLSDAIRRMVGGYSKGMRQRLNLAQALLGDPEVLVMDEPMEGLDPQGVREFFQLLRARGIRTVVLSSHRLSEVCAQVDRVCILGHGAVRALGTVEDLLQGVQLPVRIHIYPTQPLNGTLDAALRRLGAASVVKGKGTGEEALLAEVPQAAKTAFLLGLNAHREEIRHLHIEEPSLERVYFESD